MMQQHTESSSTPEPGTENTINPFAAGKRGRKKELDASHPVVEEIRNMYKSGEDTLFIAVQTGVDYSTIKRWEAKGWLSATPQPPRPRGRPRKPENEK